MSKARDLANLLNSNSKIATGKFVADAIDGTLIADDVINSEHLASGGVDDAHLATGITASKLTGTVADARISALTASKLTGNLPAISGASLTNIPATITKSTSEPTATTNPSGGVGTLWLRTTTGMLYCCTTATTNSNVWKNVGDGTGNKP